MCCLLFPFFNVPCEVGFEALRSVLRALLAVSLLCVIRHHSLCPSALLSFINIAKRISAARQAVTFLFLLLLCISSSLSPFALHVVLLPTLSRGIIACHVDVLRVCVCHRCFSWFAQLLQSIALCRTVSSTLIGYRWQPKPKKQRAAGCARPSVSPTHDSDEQALPKTNGGEGGGGKSSMLSVGELFSFSLFRSSLLPSM